MALWQLALVALYALIFAAVAVLGGDPAYLIPVAVLGLLVVGFGAGNRALRNRALRRHGGDSRAAMADSDDPVPSTPDIPDDDRPAGDTTEAHDEISPHDFPLDHPGR